MIVWLLFLVNFEYINCDFWVNRKNVLEIEKLNGIGGNIPLNQDEVEINRFLLKLKHEEYMNYDDGKFPPANNFEIAKPHIHNSRLFHFIKRFPKGGSLHTHLLSATNTDYIINNICYRPNLYECRQNGTLKLRFISEGKGNEECNWNLVKDLRKSDKNYDLNLKSYLSISRNGTKSLKWRKIQEVLNILEGLLSYRPVFEEYIQEALAEHDEDNIQYIEFRGTFLNLYEQNGTILSQSDSMKIFKNVVNKYTSEHPHFLGGKFIYAPHKVIKKEELNEHKKLLYDMSRKHFDFIIGFDITNLQENGVSLKDYAEELLIMDKNMQYFFHAGETNWVGTSNDNNLLDALLLGANRLGHAYSLIKHPEILRIIKERNIAIELCPISNQMMGLVSDLRNHPGSMYIANNLRIVLCNDYPGLWNSTGVTYDWYLTYLAMTDENAGIEFLKEVALNSIRYSGLNKLEKDAAFRVYQKKWDAYVEETNAMFMILKKMFRG